ncbi:MAG: SoxR reducing system RseC family protein [Clostridia bacterium]|nr:SoxR reducing system RseC family protein [Clostridia bacterium]
MIKFGQVTAYNEKTRVATITYIRPEACAKCGACGGLSQTGSIDLKAECKVGNWVKVVLPDGRFMTATALAYIVPLIGFLIGLFAGNALSGGSELWALGGSIIGLGVCLIGLKLNEKRIAGKPEWTPHVAEVYTERPDSLDAIGCSGME